MDKFSGLVVEIDPRDRPPALPPPPAPPDVDPDA